MATDNQIREALQIAYDAGFRGIGLVHAVAIAIRESGLNAKARCYNVYNPETKRNECWRDPTGRGGPPPPHVKVRSIDRGWWQINSEAHPSVTDAMADDPRTAAREAYRISGGGTNFRAWVAFTTGAFRDQLARVSRIAGVMLHDLPKVGEKHAYTDPTGAAGDTGTRPPAATPVGWTDFIPGPFGDFLGGLPGAAGGILGGITDAARKELLAGALRLGVTVTLLAAGGALVVIGAYRAVQPTMQKGQERAAALAGAALKGAA